MHVSGGIAIATAIMHSQAGNALAVSAIKSKSCRCSPGAEVPQLPAAGPASCEGVFTDSLGNFASAGDLAGCLAPPEKLFHNAFYISSPLGYRSPMVSLSSASPLLLLLKVCFLSLSRERYT